MAKRAGPIIFLLLAMAFLVMNRGAYRGFFENDDLSTLGWTPEVPPLDYVKIALSPLYQTNNFRPVGHFYYRITEQFFGLDFPRYVAIVHAMHLFNVWLLWLLTRRLGAKLWTAAATCVFFAFHMALFEALWKPMYVFDVLCGTFCMLSLLAYSRQYWVLSLVAFWLAYKSKEVAVMLPIALACYEYWFGNRRWLRVAPFFVVSLSFGFQGMLLNPYAGQNNNYTFSFTPAALVRTSVFYASRVFLVPYLGFVIPLAALLARNRRTWFGLVTMVVLFLPMLFLPGRLHGAYCYVPFTGLAIAFSGVAESVNPVLVTVFLLLWIPLDYRALRAQRRATLAVDDEVREWVSTIAGFAKIQPRLDAMVYAGAPAGMDNYGVEGALHYLFHRSDFVIQNADAPEPSKLQQRNRIVLLNWNYQQRKLSIVSRMSGTDAAFIEINALTPIWQLGDGWYGREGSYRWIAPEAVAWLNRQQGAHRFELRVNVGPELLQKVGPVTVQVSLNDRDLARQFAQPGWQEAEWSLPGAPPGTVRVIFHVEPGYRPPESQPLGIAVGTFGFKP